MTVAIILLACMAGIACAAAVIALGLWLDRREAKKWRSR